MSDAGFDGFRVLRTHSATLGLELLLALTSMSSMPYRPLFLCFDTASEDDIHGRLRCVSWPCVSLRDLSTRSRLRPLRLSGHQFEMRVRLCRTMSQGMAHCA